MWMLSCLCDARPIRCRKPEMMALRSPSVDRAYMMTSPCSLCQPTSPPFSSSLPHFLPFPALLCRPSLALSSQPWSIGKVPLQSSMSSVRGSNPLFFSNFFFMIPRCFAGRCFYQARACYRRNLSVRVFHRDDAIHFKAYGIKPTLVGSSYATSASR